MKNSIILAVIMFSTSFCALAQDQGPAVLLDVKVFTTEKPAKVNSLLASMCRTKPCNTDKTAASLYTVEDAKIAKLLNKVPKKKASLISTGPLAMKTGETIRLDLRKNCRLLQKYFESKTNVPQPVYKNYKLGTQFSMTPSFNAKSDSVVIETNYLNRQIASVQKYRFGKNNVELPDIINRNVKTTVCIPMGNTSVLAIGAMGNETIYLVVHAELEQSAG